VRPWLRQIERRLDALSLRERVLVLLACLGVAFVVLDAAALRPLTSAAALAAEARATVMEQSRSLEARAVELEATLSRDPHRAVRDEVDRLARELAVLNASLSHRTSELLSPDRMAELLEEMLAASPAGSVTRLEALPPEPLIGELGAANAGSPSGPAGAGGPAAAPRSAAAAAGPTGDPSKPATVPKGVLFRHGMRIELDATFHETLAFLDVLEALPASLLFGSLRYEVVRYPRARVVIEVYTLGTREGWVGV
jgi:MSHA biogenesis protein MshJ